MDTVFILALVFVVIGLIYTIAQHKSNTDKVTINQRVDHHVDWNSSTQIDLLSITHSLKLEESGRVRGEKNLPLADTTTFDEIEHSVITWAEKEQQRYLDTILDRLRDFRHHVAPLDFEQKAFEFTNTARSALGDFRARVHQGRDELFQLRRDVGCIENDLVAFRKQHQLDRMAHYPESRMWHWAIILVIVLVESLLNGSFLARGDESGLIGGIIQALGIAMINVFIGLVAGRLCLPELAHRVLWRRIVGGITGLMLVMLAFTFNLGVAHYRNTLGGPLPEQAIYNAWTNFVQSPFGVNDVLSWLLFLIGIAFSFVALLDGLQMDDLYPEYGTLARKQQTLNDDYAKTKKGLLEELEKIRNEVVKKFNQLVKRIAEDVQKLKNKDSIFISVHQQSLKSLEQNRRYLQQCGNSLLTVYRDANRHSRSTPIPAHFYDTWIMRSLTLTQDVTEHQQLIPKLESILAEKFKELQRLSHDISTAYDEAVLQYHKIEQLTPEALEHGA